MINQKKQNKNGHRRSHRGTASFIEVALGSFILFICVALGLDAYEWTTAYMINDEACRDACRSAASAQSPTNTEVAYVAAAKANALAQLKLHVNNGPWISNPQLVNWTATSWNDYGGPGSGTAVAPQTPNVTVETSIDLKLPASIPFLGISVKGSNGNTLTLQRKYVFPIANLRPS